MSLPQSHQQSRSFAILSKVAHSRLIITERTMGVFQVWHSDRLQQNFSKWTHGGCLYYRQKSDFFFFFFCHPRSNVGRESMQSKCDDSNRDPQEKKDKAPCTSVTSRHWIITSFRPTWLLFLVQFQFPQHKFHGSTKTRWTYLSQQEDEIVSRFYVHFLKDDTVIP